MTRLLIGASMGLLAAAGLAAAPATAPATRPVDRYSLTPEAFFKLPEVKQRIKKDSLDVALLEVAVFQQSNVQRAENKLPAFKHSWALQVMARGHSQDMEKLQYFDHTSPTPGMEHIADRLRAVGLENVAAGENIAVEPTKQMGSGTYVITKNADGTETWRDQKSGKIVDYCTYEELAKVVMTNWMNSPPHRENMLRKGFVYLGVGAARGPYDVNKQDSVYFTQNFSSGVNGPSEEKARKEVEKK